MLLVNNLSFARNDKEIFKDLDFSVGPKRIIHIAGRNGIGKTTLIKILANILIPKTGEIYWNGKNVKKNLRDFFKNSTLIMDIHTSKSELTVFENTIFWKRLFSSKIKQTELESIFKILSLNKNSKAGFLSKGEIKKLELCRLIIEQKKLWLLDEPYVGLDESSIKLINETFNNHIENEGMIIFSSNSQPQLKNMDTIHLENYANN